MFVFELVRLDFGAIFESKPKPRGCSWPAVIDNAQKANLWTIYTHKTSNNSEEPGPEFNGLLSTVMIANFPSSYDAFGSAIMHCDNRESTFDNVEEVMRQKF
ncbi:hypothetical protein TTRE_0000783901 [Trichuris trichiura]|uniref:Uncharacterized protein n=1 Tax=Trichuris trichiura TaxID=36087 RepID=A0A077ZI71_TRITR|nr:hypothetical protein TTRE_0000783901 [Trichuris trichiura]